MSEDIKNDILAQTDVPISYDSSLENICAKLSNIVVFSFCCGFWRYWVSSP